MEFESEKFAGQTFPFYLARLHGANPLLAFTPPSGVASAVIANERASWYAKRAVLSHAGQLRFSPGKIGSRAVAVRVSQTFTMKPQ